MSAAPLRATTLGATLGTTLSLALGTVLGTALGAALALASSCTPPTAIERAPTPPDLPALDRATLLPQAAERLCAALERCCDADSHERFFAPWVALESFDDLDPELPPARPLESASCRPLVEELLLRRPFGAWLEAADRGLVQLELEPAQDCLGELEAECGEALNFALEDRTCFALGPPAGGAEQRRMFSRKSTSGPCTALNDGVGGVLYGTCDPSQAFCCVGEDGCGFAAPGETGTCVPVSAVDGGCSMAPLQLCPTGASCGMDDRCHADSTAPLAVDEPCIDDDFALLGECVDAFCDVGGSGTCQATVGVGEPCDQPPRCVTGLCEEGRCIEDAFCRP